MGGSGGYRRLPGGSDDFSLQTDRHFIIIYISPSSSGFFPGASKACRGVGPHMLPHFCQVLYEDLPDVDDYVSSSTY